jgi:hypothetical protein
MSSTLIDGHVHFHECFRLSRFLEAAWANRNAVSCQGPVCLLLAQIPEGDPLRLPREQTSTLSRPWQLVHVACGTMVFEREGTPVVFLISGRQLTSKEGLEILALATEADLSSGLPLVDVVASINDVGAVPVLPWGFGKWWFQRGEVLAKLMDTDGMSFLLGDNGGRPSQMGRPKLLQAAEQKGIAVLAGSDPLPLRGQISRVGSFGSLISGLVDFDDPRTWIQSRLQSLASSPATRGRCRSLAGFLSDQVRIRL